MSLHDTQRAIEAVWRIESPRLVASLTRRLGDLGQAEELVQDALVAALEHWPRDGVPANPAAWLMTTARNRALDRLRQGSMQRRKHDELACSIEAWTESPTIDSEALDSDVGDDLLRLMFIACHPVLSSDARVALTLRLLAGLSTAEIARAFLSSEPTIAQRIVRAKRSLAEAQVPFELPTREQLPERLASVLECVYLIFNEGYTASAGEDWMRPALCEEALRQGRVLVALMPRQSEALALLALMELQASRSHARTDANGQPILLREQNRLRWDRLAIRRGLDALSQAQSLGGGDEPYALQAAIAACHAQAEAAEQTDWPRIAALYARLAARQPSPVVELNRAVAMGMAFGAEAGLVHAESLRNEPRLAAYHLLPAVRGEFLQQLGRLHEAAEAFQLAAKLACNARERELLAQRAVDCHAAGPAQPQRKH
jgi:RNA polymerase sigma factor (sigma-70 family)